MLCDPLHEFDRRIVFSREGQIEVLHAVVIAQNAKRLN